jgi:Ca2+/H+ antiporter
MDLITFAIIVALMELVVGLSLLLSPVRAMDRVCEILDNPALLSVIMYGFLAVSVSAIFRDGEFEWKLRGVITCIALLTSVKALLYIWFPQKMASTHRRILRRDKPLRTRCIGAFMLLYFVFFSWSAQQMLQLQEFV